MSHDTESGASVYSPWVLRLYDAWVLGLSNRHAWRCSTASVLLPFFREHAGSVHLDVGVGTGFYPAKAKLPDTSRITLLDLNPASLQAARRRLGRATTTIVRHDVMTPLPARRVGTFDAISLFYLLHCLSGTMADKARVFAHLKPHLRPGGVLYGATILGDEAGHNRFGRNLMAIYNRKGIFGNRRDTHEGLERALRQHFARVRRARGRQGGLVFEARRPLP